MRVRWNCELTKRERMDRYLDNYLFNNMLLEDNVLSDVEIIKEMNKIKSKYYENNNIFYKNNNILSSHHIEKLNKLEVKIYNNLKIEYMEKIIVNISHIKC